MCRSNSDTKVSPIPSVNCFACVPLAQSNLCGGFDLMEISPQHRSVQGLSIEEKTDTGSRSEAIGTLFFSLAILQGVL